jgi:hypothetical protein
VAEQRRRGAFVRLVLAVALAVGLPSALWWSGTTAAHAGQPMVAGSSAVGSAAPASIPSHARSTSARAGHMPAIIKRSDVNAGAAGAASTYVLAAILLAAFVRIAAARTVSARRATAVPARAPPRRRQ